MENYIRQLFPNAQTPVREDCLAALRAESPPLPYAILITARSGSTFLTHALKPFARFGTPHEYFNPEPMKRYSQANKIESIDQYVRYIWKENTSGNGVFGIEFSWHQYCSLNELLNWQECFRQQVVWFLLRRRNLVAQAISLDIANQTKVFHSYQLADGRQTAGEANYDAEAIQRNLSMLLKEEMQIDDYLGQRSINPVPLFYEELVKDPDKVVQIFCNTLRVSRAVLGRETTNPIRKIGGAINEEFEARFRREHPSVLDEARRLRPALLKPDATV